MLGSGGTPFALLMPRSVDFGLYHSLLVLNVPRARDVRLLLSLLQVRVCMRGCLCVCVHDFFFVKKESFLGSSPEELSTSTRRLAFRSKGKNNPITQFRVLQYNPIPCPGKCNEKKNEIQWLILCSDNTMVDVG